MDTSASTFWRCCRTCMLQGQNFQSFSDYADNTKIDEMLAMVVPQLLIISTEPLPTQLCAVCLNTLRSAFKFQQMCIASEKNLRSILCTDFCTSLPSTSTSTTIGQQERTPVLEEQFIKIESDDLAEKSFENIEPVDVSTTHPSAIAATSQEKDPLLEENYIKCEKHEMMETNIESESDAAHDVSRTDKECKDSLKATGVVDVERMSSRASGVRELLEEMVLLTDTDTVREYSPIANTKMASREMDTVRECSPIAPSNENPEDDSVRSVLSSVVSEAPHSDTKVPFKCRVCSLEHKLQSCPKFIAMNLEERLRVVLPHFYCSNCLSSSHMRKECRSLNRCRHCNDDHHSLLHSRSRVRTGRAHSRRPRPRHSRAKKPKNSKKPKAQEELSTRRSGGVEPRRSSWKRSQSNVPQASSSRDYFPKWSPPENRPQSNAPYASSARDRFPSKQTLS